MPPALIVLAGTFECTWGAIVAFSGVVLVKTATGIGFAFGSMLFVVVIAIFVLPGVLMLIAGLWLIWRARWARSLGLISTTIVVFESLALGDGLGLMIGLGVLVVFLFATLRS